MLKLFVDDLRRCPDGWVPARTITEAVKLLLMFPFEVVSLDHDMSCTLVDGHFHTSKETFATVARVIALLPKQDRPKEVYIHTGNPDAGREMEQILSGNVKTVIIDTTNGARWFEDKTPF